MTLLDATHIGKLRRNIITFDCLDLATPLLLRCVQLVENVGHLVSIVHGTKRARAAIIVVLRIEPPIVAQIDEYLAKMHVAAGEGDGSTDVRQTLGRRQVRRRLLGRRWSLVMIIRVDARLRNEPFDHSMEVYAARIIIGFNQLDECCRGLRCQIGPDGDAKLPVRYFGKSPCRVRSCYGAFNPNRR